MSRFFNFFGYSVGILMILSTLTSTIPYVFYSFLQENSTYRTVQIGLEFFFATILLGLLIIILSIIRIRKGLTLLRRDRTNSLGKKFKNSGIAGLAFTFALIAAKNYYDLALFPIVLILSALCLHLIIGGIDYLNTNPELKKIEYNKINFLLAGLILAEALMLTYFLL